MASGGTGDFLAEAGIDFTSVAQVTGQPEMMGGRVKTLHPGIHGPILARRSVEEDVAELAAAGYGHIDAVVCNLYPTPPSSFAGIDVGGPSMIWGCIKNHEDGPFIVVDPENYSAVLSDLQAHDNVLSGGMRVYLTGKAVKYCRNYAAGVAAWVLEQLG